MNYQWQYLYTMKLKSRNRFGAETHAIIFDDMTEIACGEFGDMVCLMAKLNGAYNLGRMSVTVAEIA